MAKYVIIDNSVDISETIILFPEYMDHKTMSMRVNLPGGTVASAGFVRIGKDGKPECYGESKSLEITPSPKRLDQDNILLRASFMFGTK